MADLRVNVIDNMTRCFNTLNRSLFSVDGQFYAIQEKHDICVLEFNEKNHLLPLKSFKLKGHRKSVLSLCLSNAPTPLLCSCSDDSVIIWEMEQIKNHWKLDCKSEVEGLRVGVNLGPASDCALSCDNSWLALCVDNNVWLVLLQHRNNQLTEVSHHATLGTGGSCCFSPIFSNVLVTRDEYSYKVWNTTCSRPVHRETIGRGGRVSFCDFVLTGVFRGRLILGTTLGHVYLYDVSDHRSSRNVVLVIVSSQTFLYQKVVTGSGDSCESSCVILCALLMDPLNYKAVSGTASQEGSIISAIVAPATLMVVCSNLGISVFDCNSRECHTSLTFQEMFKGEDCTPILVSAASISVDPTNSGHLHCLIMSCVAGQATVHHIDLELSWSSNMGQLTFLSTTALSARSPLRVDMPRCDPKASLNVIYGAQNHAGQSRPTRPVKSSGYGRISTRQRFVPVTNFSSATSSAESGRGQKKSTGLGIWTHLDHQSMLSWGPPLRIREKICVWDEHGAAVRLASSGDGRNLACSSGPILNVLRWSRLSVDNCTSMAAHNARITSLGFSADSSWLLSSSSDGSSKIWDWRSKRCVAVIGGARNSKDIGAIQRSKKKELVRIQEVAQSAFYYLDKFILRAVGGTLEMYAHALHDSDPALWSSVRRVRKIKFPTQEITCFAAPNNFHSNLVVAGCSSRSLHVYDVNVEKFVLDLHDAHPRAPHCLTLATPSSAASQPQSAADIFLSAALCDGVKLWDLRQMRCVQKYNRHLNRAYPTNVALSPCCRYVAVGSEDKCAYLYDTRRCHDYVDKLMGLNEVVFGVAWNPCRPQLGASALNGYVAVYGDSAE